MGCPEELNEEYSECNNHPCQNTCESPNFIQVCSYSEGCYPGCICRENYLRNDNGVCVYKDNCPRKYKNNKPLMKINS